MTSKIKKIISVAVLVIAAAAVLNSCSSHEKVRVEQDCSAIFDVRDKSGKPINQAAVGGKEDSDLVTECKILEIKIDKNARCEFVGSNRIDYLLKSIEEGSDDKIVLIAPKDQIKDLSKIADKYLSSAGFDLKKHFDNELLKSSPFPYNGLRCDIAGKQVVIWSGKEKLILTIENK